MRKMKTRPSIKGWIAGLLPVLILLLSVLPVRGWASPP